MKGKGMRGLVQRFAAVGGVLILGVVTTLALLSGVTHAASGVMSVSSATVTHGNNVTLTVSLNTSTPVDSVSALVKYDSSKLTYVSTDVSSSSFDTTLPGSSGSGTVDIERTTLSQTSGMTGNLTIARVTFTALPYSGTTSVSLDPSSVAAHAGSSIGATLSAGTVTFTPGNCPSGQTGTPPSCTTPPPSGGGTTSGGGGTSGSGTSGSTGGTTKSSGGSTTTKSSGNSPSTGSTTTSTSSSTGTKTSGPSLAAPTISGTNFEYTVGTVTVTTNLPTQVYVKWGLRANALTTQTALTDSATSHTITLSDNLPIGTAIYYQVAAENGDTTTTSAVESTETKGLAASILIQDKNHKPVPNQSVTIEPEGVTVKTSSTGYAVFSDLTPGQHQVELKSGTKTHTTSFNLLSNIVASGADQVAPQQSAVIAYPDYTYTPVSLWLYLLIVLIIALLVAFLVIVHKRRNNPFNRPLEPLPEGSLVSGGSAGAASSSTSPTVYNPFSPNDNNNNPPQAGI